MSLRHAVLAGWIARLSLFGSDLALTGNAALQLRLHFLPASLFERVSTSTSN
jgi:hypothetical protein